MQVVMETTLNIMKHLLSVYKLKFPRGLLPEQISMF